jgi:hypothetical protein
MRGARGCDLLTDGTAWPLELARALLSVQRERLTLTETAKRSVAERNSKAMETLIMRLLRLQRELERTRYLATMTVGGQNVQMPWHRGGGVELTTTGQVGRATDWSRRP